MKKQIGLVVVVLMLMLLANNVHAQESGAAGELIVLNDATPGIDVVINPSPDTTGVIALEVADAIVTVTDAVGNVVFQTSDSHLHGLEIQFAPNAGTHTLTIERLPGAPQAYARIQPLSVMTELGPADLTSGTTLAVMQEADYPLNNVSPSASIVIDTAALEENAITTSFPGAPVTVQLVNRDTQTAVATLQGSLIDSIRFYVDGGSYELVMLNNNPASQTVANVAVLEASISDFDALVAAAENASTTMVGTTATNPASDPSTTCAMTVTASSVNLRSGPGTGYSVLNYAFRGEQLPVGGVNIESGWLLVGTTTGSGWVSNTAGTLAGNCDALTAYDIPYREAPAPALTIQQPQVPVYHEDEDEEYEDEDEEHEGEHGDEDEGEDEGDDD